MPGYALATHHVTLPSGLKAKVKETSIWELDPPGRIPDLFLPVVKGLTGIDPGAQEEIARLADDEDAVLEFSSFLLQYAQRALIKPKLTLGTGKRPGRVRVEDLTPLDFLVLLLLGGAVFANKSGKPTGRG
jgi:hypothetical protein